MIYCFHYKLAQSMHCGVLTFSSGYNCKVCEWRKTWSRVQEERVLINKCCKTRNRDLMKINRKCDVLNATTSNRYLSVDIHRKVVHACTNVLSMRHKSYSTYALRFVLCCIYYHDSLYERMLILFFKPQFILIYALELKNLLPLWFYKNTLRKLFAIIKNNFFRPAKFCCWAFLLAQ